MSHAYTTFDCAKQSSGPVPSMVHDALQHVDEGGILRNEARMKHVKEAAATAFLGRLFARPDRSLTRLYS